MTTDHSPSLDESELRRLMAFASCREQGARALRYSLALRVWSLEHWLRAFTEANPTPGEDD